MFQKPNSDEPNTGSYPTPSATADPGTQSRAWWATCVGETVQAASQGGATAQLMTLLGADFSTARLHQWVGDRSTSSMFAQSPHSVGHENMMTGRGADPATYQTHDVALTTAEAAQGVSAMTERLQCCGVQQEGCCRADPYKIKLDDWPGREASSQTNALMGSLSSGPCSVESRLGSR